MNFRNADEDRVWNAAMISALGDPARANAASQFADLVVRQLRQRRGEPELDAQVAKEA